MHTKQGLLRFCRCYQKEKKYILAEENILLGKSNPKKISCRIIWLLIKNPYKRGDILTGSVDWIEGRMFCMLLIHSRT